MTTTNTTSFDFSKILNAADTATANVAASKVAVALAMVSHGAGDSINEALQAYGIDAVDMDSATKKGLACYNKALGFRKDYLKPVFEIREHLTLVLKAISTVEFTTYANTAKQVLALDMYGEFPVPHNRTTWVEFLKGFLPEQEKEQALSLSADKAPTKPAPKKETATKKGKGNADAKDAASAVDSNFNNRVSALLSEVENKTADAINHHVDALISQGVPAKFKKDIASAMVALLADQKANLEKQMKVA